MANSKNNTPQSDIQIVVDNHYAHLIGDEILASVRPPGIRRIEFPTFPSKEEEEQRKLELEIYAEQDWFST